MKKIIFLLLVFGLLFVGCVTTRGMVKISDGVWFDPSPGSVMEEAWKRLSDLRPTGKAYFEGGYYVWDEKGITSFYLR